MPEDCCDEHATVERHESEHDQEREPRADCMHHCLGKASSDAAGPIPDELALREELDEDGEGEGESQGKDVHPGAVSRPAGEEDLAVLAPKEGHVLHR